MNYLLLAEQVQQYVTGYFEQHDDSALPYHNLYHTQEVVKAAAQIANHYQLSDGDFFITATAAWFHDSGYFTDAKNHEEKGAELAETFLQGKAVDAEIILAVQQCILATRMPQKPEGLLQQIVCDADLFHLGTEELTERSKLMRKEAEATMQASISKHEWRQGTMALLQAHHYHTEYCRLLLGTQKQKNLEALVQKEKEWLEQNKPEAVITQPAANGEPGSTDQHEKKTKNKKSNTNSLDSTISQEKTGKKEAERPDKGIETMFRVASSNHQRLSDMADNKANIMITVNSIILSAILSLLLRRLEDNPHLAIPTFMILSVSLMAMIFAILATRPHIPDGTFSPQDVSDKTVNLLFFGNFYRMGLPEYAAGMAEVMKDRDFLYGSLIKDVYSQGVVLGHKYRLLRISYNIFMFGLIISVAAFIIASAVVAKH